MSFQIGRNPWSVVLYFYLQRQRYPCGRTWCRKANAWAESRAQGNLPVASLITYGFGRIFHKVQERLDKLVPGRFP